MEIVRQEVGDTMRCFGDKNLCKTAFFAAILCLFGRGRETFAERTT